MTDYERGFKEGAEAMREQIAHGFDEFDGRLPESERVSHENSKSKWVRKQAIPGLQSCGHPYSSVEPTGRPPATIEGQQVYNATGYCRECMANTIREAREGATPKP